MHFSAREMGTLREPLVGSTGSSDLKTSQSASGRLPMSPPPSSSASSTSSASPSSSQGYQPPTLFGNSRTRAEVATLVSKASEMAPVDVGYFFTGLLLFVVGDHR